jgi:UDP-arabinose 4-epimerase
MMLKKKLSANNLAHQNLGKKSVLVTGGAGYIGSHVCKALHQHGYNPVVYDNLIYGHLWAVKWGPFEQGDIHNRATLREALKKHEIGAVIHLAAFAYVGESVEDPAKYYHNNFIGTWNVLDAIRSCGINKIVFSSSCATYGIPGEALISEEHPQNPVNPYGTSKLMTEHMLKDYAQAYGLKYISLRYFNAAGADPEGEIGEAHNPETHLIPLVLQVASKKRPKLTIFGNDYDTPDGTCVRDYVHVTDLAEAHVQAFLQLETNQPSSIYNLGNGTGFSILEVIDIARKVTGKEIPFCIGPRRLGDPARLVANSEKARVKLLWNPKHGLLTSILETAWRWQELDRSRG